MIIIFTLLMFMLILGTALIALSPVLLDIGIVSLVIWLIVRAVKKHKKKK